MGYPPYDGGVGIGVLNRGIAPLVYGATPPGNCVAAGADGGATPMLLNML
jgi:hypothetical protein